MSPRDVLARACHRANCAIHRPYLSDIEWKIIYVGSAESEEHDQVSSMSSMLLVSHFPDTHTLSGSDHVVGVSLSPHSHAHWY